jgi:hypothetical protein
MFKYYLLIAKLQEEDRRLELNGEQHDFGSFWHIVQTLEILESLRPSLHRYSGPMCCWPKWDHLEGSKRHAFSKISLAQVWTQMSLALSSIKVWNMKRWIEGLIMKGHIQQPMRHYFAFPHEMKSQMVFLMWHEKALIGQDG